MTPRWPRFGAALLGLVWYLHLGGGVTLNPLHTTWLFDGDWLQHWLGWLFFRREPWTFPIGTMASLPYPVGTMIGFTDSNPLVSILLKPFSAWLPAEVQFIGPWLAGCFMLQGYLGALLTSTVTDDAGQQLLGGYLFALSPVLAVRIGHDTLCAHWLILGLLYLGLRACDDPRAARRGAWMAAGAAMLAALIHPYLAAMCWVLAQAVQVRLWRANAIGWPRAAAMVALGTAGMLSILYVVGYLSREGVSSSGFGVYSADLLALINPANLSRLLPSFVLDKSQWEGLGYVGLGGLAAGAMALVMAARARPRLRPGSWIVVAACVAMSVYALSDTITLGGTLVARARGFYSHFHALTGPFRASGRFVWPLHYLVLLAGIWGITRIGRRARPSGAAAGAAVSTATAVLAVAVAVQAADFNVDARVLGPKNVRQASAEAFAPAAGRFRHLAVYPMQILGVCGEEYHEPYVYRFMLEAYRRGLTFNSGIFARLSAPRVAQACGDLFREVDSGRFDPDTLYVVWPSSVPRVREVGGTCARFDGDWVCVGPHADPAYRRLLETGRLNEK